MSVSVQPLVFENQLQMTVWDRHACCWCKVWAGKARQWVRAGWMRWGEGESKAPCMHAYIVVAVVVVLLPKWAARDMYAVGAGHFLSLFSPFLQLSRSLSIISQQFYPCPSKYNPRYVCAYLLFHNFPMLNPKWIHHLIPLNSLLTFCSH